MNLTSQHRGAASTQRTAPISTDLADELQRYDAHLRDGRGLASETRRLSVSIVQRLLQQKFSGRPLDIGQLRPDDMRRFLAHQLDLRQSSSRARQLAGALRSYLRYRSICGDQVGDLKAAITNPVHWKLASLPRALAPDEVDRLLKSFATVRRARKRGYAIVRCALDMGLRAGEIAGLKIADVDWRSGTVTLRGTKSKRQDVLPLPVEAGQALADYLQHERPRTCSPAVFVRCYSDCDQPMTSTAVQKVILRACRRIGLTHASSHAMRHTLACRLVENGSSLKEVADVLRHRSLETTRIYAKLDTPKLSAVPLPWPGCAS